MIGSVVVVGSLNIDTVTRVRAHPRPGETVLGLEMRHSPGGKGANQAVAAARAGATVKLVGRIGADGMGEWYLSQLAGRGVDVATVRRTAGCATGSAQITVDDTGENSIIVIPGANAAVTPDDVDAAAGIIRAAAVLLLQLEIPLPAALRAAELAAEAGVRVVLNASPPADLPVWLLRLADPVIVNQHELGPVAEHAASVCCTRGSAGAHWGEAAASPPVSVADTTGAGDAFAGTLAAHLAIGAPAEAALRAAVVAGADATTWHGAQGWELTHLDPLGSPECHPSSRMAGA